MQELVEKLQSKLKQYKKMAEEAVRNIYSSTNSFYLQLAFLNNCFQAETFIISNNFTFFVEAKKKKL